MSLLVVDLPRARRRFCRNVLYAGLAAASAGCSALTGPQEITLSERELARHLEREFPRQQRMLEVLDVEISSPMLELVPERNRLASGFRLAVRDRLFGSSNRGHIGFESALRFETRDHTMRLAEVRVHEFRLDDQGGGRITTAGPSQDTPGFSVQRIGSLLAEQMLEDHVVWRASDEQVSRLSRSGYKVGAVIVTNAGVRISFEPMSR